MVLQASKLNLPHSSLSSPEITSLLFEPHSRSLALMHSDTSFSLYPSLSPFSLSSLSPPQTLIPSPSSSASFLLLHPNPNPNSPNPNSPNPRVLFVVAGPHSGGFAVLLRFWILRKTKVFAKAKVLCNQNDLRFDDKLGVVVNVNHGFSVKLVSSINVFALYSVSAGKVWVFAAKMADNDDDDDDDGVVVRLVKCAVIECCVPVFSISVSFGFLILGEQNGVRVFPLRPLVKGRVKRVRGSRRRENVILNCSLNNDKLERQGLNLPNGAIRVVNGSNDFYDNSIINSKYAASGSGGESSSVEGSAEVSSNGYLEGKIEKHIDSVKLRSVKLRQDSSEGSACFAAFKSKEVESLKSTKIPLMTAKAISIQALSPNKFLILDSVGDLHFLRLSNPVLGSEITCHMRQLTHMMKVQRLAVLPDISIRTQTVWISDGFHSVHTMGVSDMDTSVNENDRNDSEEKLMQFSVIQAIFASEKIQDIVPLAANAILILGQGSIFAYAVS